MKQNIRLAASAVALLALGACQVSSTNQSSEASETQSVAKLAEVRMNPDTAYLSAEEREVVNLLIQAADLMQPIYLRQVSRRQCTASRRDREVGRQGASSRGSTR